MTTPERAAIYEAEFVREYGRGGPAVFNPHNRDVSELPTIYGFNNGGSADWWYAKLLAEDGTPLGSHLCSSEGYMPHDLGILEGSRPDRHESFREHYPDGYRMEFVSLNNVKSHGGLMAAIAKAAETSTVAG